MTFLKPKHLWLTLKAGLFYFAAVFTVGFGLGVIRVLWAVPRFGTRTAELMEMPLMLITIMLVAFWVCRRFSLAPGLRSLGVGLVALGLSLLAEISVVLQLRGLSVAEYWANRDPVSGTVYFAMLGLFALMPWLITAGQSEANSPA